MVFDEWWRRQDERFRHAMLKPDMREVWEAATKEEREECAGVCDALVGKVLVNGEHGTYWKNVAVAEDCAEAIRMRSNV